MTTTRARSKSESGRLASPWPARSAWTSGTRPPAKRSEEHTSELQSRRALVCRLPLEKKNYRSSICTILLATTLSVFLIAARSTYSHPLSLHDALPICVPGVQDVKPLDNDNYEGTLKVRVGPISLSLAGKISMDQRAEAAGKEIGRAHV